jgi:hypothetical protein
LDRRGARDRAHRPRAGHRLLHAGGGVVGDSLLEVSGALGCPAGPLAQALELACLGEDEQRQDRDTHEGSERGNGADLGERARE